MAFGYDFNPTEGNVPPLLDRDEDGVQDVGGALDRYLSGDLAARYLF